MTHYVKVCAGVSAKIVVAEDSSIESITLFNPTNEEIYTHNDCFELNGRTLTTFIFNLLEDFDV